MGVRVRFYYIGVLLATLVLAGCGGGSNNPRPPQNAATFTLGGTVSGLAGAPVVLRNATTDLSVSANGNFTFTGALPRSTAYNVTVATQPANPPQICTVTNGSGTINANVTNVTVTCAAAAALTVASSTPTDGASSFARTQGIVVTFSTALDVGTVSGSDIALSSAGGEADIEIAVVGAELRITPNSRLQANTDYTLTIPSDVRGTLGESLAGIVEIDFTTAARSWGTAGFIPGDSSKDKTGFDYIQAPGGDVLIAWTDQELLPAGGGQPERLVSEHWFARYSATTGWSAPQQLGSDAWLNPDPGEIPTSTETRIAAASNGNIVVSHFTGDQARLIVHRYTSSGGWESERTLDSSDPTSFVSSDIAVDSDGNAIAVWMRFEGSFTSTRASRFAPGGTWSAPELLEHPSTALGFSDWPQVEFDAGGNALAIWDHLEDAGTDSDVWAARYERAGGWQPATLIAQTPNSESPPVLHVDPSGHAVLLFVHGDEELWSAEFTPASGWSTAAAIPSTPTGTELPLLHLNSSLNGFAVWRDFSPGRTAVRTAQYSAAGGWVLGPTIDDPSAGDADGPAVGVDANGNAVAVWCQEPVGENNTWAATFAAGGQWQAAQRISQTSQAVFCQARVAVDPGGDATAFWALQDASDFVSIMFNRYE